MIANIPPKELGFSDFIRTFGMSFIIFAWFENSTKSGENFDMAKSWATLCCPDAHKMLNYSAAEFRMKTKGIIISLLALLNNCVCGLAGEPGVKILLKSGQQLSFCFKQKPLVKTTPQELTLYAEDKIWVSCPYADVLRMEMVDNVETGIISTKVSKNAITVKTSADAIDISGLSAGETVTICTTGGMETLHTAADTDGRVSITLSALPKGIYVITTGSGINYKFYHN